MSKYSRVIEKGASENNVSVGQTLRSVYSGVVVYLYKTSLNRGHLKL